MLHEHNNGDFPVQTNDLIGKTVDSKWQLPRVVYNNAVVWINDKRRWIWRYSCSLCLQENTHIDIFNIYEVHWFHTGLFSFAISTMLNSFVLTNNMYNASPRRKPSSGHYQIYYELIYWLQKLTKSRFLFVQYICLYTIIYICECSIFASDYKHVWSWSDTITWLRGSCTRTLYWSRYWH